MRLNICAKVGFNGTVVILLDWENENRWTDNWQGNPKYSERSLFRYQFFNRKSHVDCCRNKVLCDKKLTINNVNYSKAQLSNYLPEQMRLEASVCIVIIHGPCLKESGKYFLKHHVLFRKRCDVYFQFLWFFPAICLRTCLCTCLCECWSLLQCRVFSFQLQFHELEEKQWIAMWFQEHHWKSAVK
jgi:hypothetical protein